MFSPGLSAPAGSGITYSCHPEAMSMLPSASPFSESFTDWVNGPPSSSGNACTTSSRSVSVVEGKSEMQDDFPFDHLKSKPPSDQRSAG